MSAQLDAAKNDKDSLAKAADETATLRAQLKDANSQLDLLKSQKDSLAKAADDTATLRAQIADLKQKASDGEKAFDQQGASVADLTAANDKLTSEKKDMQASIDSLTAQASQLRGAADSLAQSRRDASDRASQLDQLTSHLASAQRDLANQRSENAQLRDDAQNNDRVRTSQLASAQQENAALAARLRQAQGTLDQIASAARLINGGGSFASAVRLWRHRLSPQRTLRFQLAPRTYVVQEGDSLTRISFTFYGTGARWQEIYDANRDLLKGESALKPGQRLRIP